MIGALCASSAQTKCTSLPCIRWCRTQLSAWMYSMMWPMWKLPLAYGTAVVTKSLRGEGMRVYPGEPVSLNAVVTLGQEQEISPMATPEQLSQALAAVIDPNTGK